MRTQIRSPQQMVLEQHASIDSNPYQHANKSLLRTSSNNNIQTRSQKSNKRWHRRIQPQPPLPPHLTAITPSMCPHCRRSLRAPSPSPSPPCATVWSAHRLPPHAGAVAVTAPPPCAAVWSAHHLPPPAGAIAVTAPPPCAAAASCSLPTSAPAPSPPPSSCRCRRDVNERLVEDLKWNVWGYFGHFE